MPFTRPTLPQIIDRIKTDLKGELSIVTILRRSFLGVISRALAAASHTLHGFLQFVARQVFPDTAESEFLLRWAGIFGVSQIQAIKAELTAKFTGLAGEIILTGGSFLRSDGLTYTLIADATIQTATAEVTDMQTRADVGGNLGGTYVEFNTPTNAYFYWFQTGADVNPAIPGRISVQVNINTNDDANTVAAALQTILDLLLDIGATVFNNVVTMTNVDTGSVDDAIDGSLAPTSFVLTIITQGLTGGEVEGNILADEADTEDQTGNIENGETLTFVSPQANVDSILTITDTVVEGEVIESELNLRTRLLDRIQQPPSGGNVNDYIQEAKKVQGVTRVWVFPANRGLGTVDVSFVEDDEVNFIPDAAKIQEVQDQIDLFRPVTTDVIVFANGTDVMDLTIKLKPNTAAVRTAVINELQDLILRDGNARGANAGPNTTFDGKILLSRINEAISLATDEQDHDLVSPVADFEPSINNLAILGSITWQTLS